MTTIRLTSAAMNAHDALVNVCEFLDKGDIHSDTAALRDELRVCREDLSAAIDDCRADDALTEILVLVSQGVDDSDLERIEALCRESLSLPAPFVPDLPKRA